MGYAADKGHIEIVKFLLEKGANVNIIDNYGNTPLLWAIDKKHLEMVKLLIENGANLNVENNIGGTPLHIAVDKEHVGIARLLIINGVDINKINKNGHNALRYLHYGDSEMKNLLTNYALITKLQTLKREPFYSEIALKLICEYCGKKHSTNQWPVNGDNTALYFQKEKGLYYLPVICPNCKKEWYVVWEENPGLIQALD